MSVTALALLLLLPAQHPDWRPDPDRDLTQFPPVEVAVAWAQFAEDHRALVRETRNWLKRQPQTWPLWDWWDSYRQEARRRADIWAALRFARDPDNSQFARDVWATRLYNLIGPDAFFAGHMPAPAPMLDDIWHRR